MIHNSPNDKAIVHGTWLPQVLILCANKDSLSQNLQTSVFFKNKLRKCSRRRNHEYIHPMKLSTNTALRGCILYCVHSVQHYSGNVTSWGPAVNANSPSGNTQPRPRYSHTCCLESQAYTHLDLRQTAGAEEEATKLLYITMPSATTSPVCYEKVTNLHLLTVEAPSL